MAEKAEHIGVEKTRLDTMSLIVLAILAGAFIAPVLVLWGLYSLVVEYNRRAVASFEALVKNVRDQYGFIDLFWSKAVLVELKSFGNSHSPATTRSTPSPP